MSFKVDRVSLTLEDKSFDWRERIERAYLAAPEQTHSKLVYKGYWDIAAQLKIDHAVGRLSPPVAELER